MPLTLRGQLPDDQAAVISVLLRRRHSYADVARLLGIDEQAVIGRAHAALVAFAPHETTPTTAAQRRLLGDYLLGQLHGSQYEDARKLLSTSRPARVWARGVAAALAQLAPGVTPEIPHPQRPAAPIPHAGPAPSGPPGARTVTRAPPTPGAAPTDVPAGARAVSDALPSSRVGGAILLLAVAALAALAIVLVTRTGGGGGEVVAGAPASPAPATASPSPFRVLARSVLAAGPTASSARGLAEIVSDGTRRELVVVASRLAPTAGLARSGFDYTLWLTGSAGTQELGVSPAVGRDRTLQALAALPTRSGFQTILVTRETAPKPAAPGRLILSGRLPSA